MDLVIRYDPEADVLVLKVKEDALADEELLANGWTLEDYIEELSAAEEGRRDCRLKVCN